MKTLVVLLFILSPAAAQNFCSSIFKGGFELESSHEAYRALRALEAKLLLPEGGITICVWESPTLYFAVPYRRKAIEISRGSLESFHGNALDGALAHELGHILATQQDVTRAKKDRLADAFALALVGPEPLFEAYKLRTRGDVALAKRRVAKAQKLLAILLVLASTCRI